MVLQLSWGRSFPAMGTTASVRVVDGHPRLLDLAQERIAALEQRWSRFLPTSDVSRVNAAAGTWVPVHGETLDLLARALVAEEATGGRFSVAVERAMAANGYARSFELGPSTGTARPCSAGRVELDVDAAAVRVELGSGIDVGGIAKGHAADLVSTELVAAGAAGALVDVGGDLRVRGDAPGRRGWTVEVDPGGQRSSVPAVALADGGVATSSTLRRRWRRPDGGVAHHVVDPRTGAPTDSGLVAVSCVAASAADAEVLAKAVLVAGAMTGRALLEHWALDGVLVDVAGRVETVGRWHSKEAA